VAATSHLPPAFDIRTLFRVWDRLLSSAAPPDVTPLPDALLLCGGICDRVDGEVPTRTGSPLPGARPTSAGGLAIRPGSAMRPSSSGGVGGGSATRSDAPYDGALYALIFDERLAAAVDIEAREEVPPSPRVAGAVGTSTTPRTGRAPAPASAPAPAASRPASTTTAGAKAGAKPGSAASKGEGKESDALRPTAAWLRVPLTTPAVATSLSRLDMAGSGTGSGLATEDETPLLRRFGHTACIRAPRPRAGSVGAGSASVAELQVAGADASVILYVAGGVCEVEGDVAARRLAGTRAGSRGTAESHASLQPASAPAPPGLTIELLTARAAAERAAAPPADADGPETDEWGGVVLGAVGDSSGGQRVRRVYDDGVYEGVTVCGVRSGAGRMAYDNGVVYDGGWEGDVWQGVGVATFPDGRRYEGEVARGAFSGTGTLSWPAGTLADITPADLITRWCDPAAAIAVGDWSIASLGGSWRDGLPHGACHITYASGATYVGALADGLIDGEGSFRIATPDGTAVLVARGTWAAGVLTGPACAWCLTLDGIDETYEGGFVGGRREGRGVAECRDGGRYEGGYRGGRRNGTGRLRLPDQSVYDGKFVGGVRCGRGTCVFANHDVYVGGWADDAMDGDGVLRHPDGTEVTGRWRGGRLVSSGGRAAAHS